MRSWRRRRATASSRLQRSPDFTHSCSAAAGSPLRLGAQARTRSAGPVPSRRGPRGEAVARKQNYSGAPIMPQPNALAADIGGLISPLPLSRRGFMTSTAAATAGYTLAAGPVSAQAITTDTAGLAAGDAKVKVADG